MLTNTRHLAMIREDLGDCRRCHLHETRQNIVFGRGNANAHLMFVGEGPGADEDEQGEPFVGRAGQLLDKIVERMGFHRDDVYIANIVKCRPTDADGMNRPPDEAEISECVPFLHQQIGAIRPSVVVTLGGPASKTLLGAEEGITKIRGQWRRMTVQGTSIDVIPTFHPAFLLRTPSAKPYVWLDMKKVLTRLRHGGIIPPMATWRAKARLGEGSN